MTAALSKREIRERSAQLRALMCAWDPIGVMNDPDCPRDEYDCLVGPLLTLLGSSGSEGEIARYLRKEIDEHFGLSPDGYDFAEVASRVRRWFDRGWRGLGEPVTIFVALLGEGTDVWRPVQARPLERGDYRLIGVEADTSDETWQFPAGTIVRCVSRHFADGTSGMIAVERHHLALEVRPVEPRGHLLAHQIHQRLRACHVCLRRPRVVRNALDRGRGEPRPYSATHSAAEPSAPMHQSVISPSSSTTLRVRSRKSGR